MAEPAASHFKDYFSYHAADYADARPRYPAEIFGWLSSVVPDHEFAWDCATGNGQAALGLVERFRTVVATDASSEQIRNVFPHERIRYRVASAESSGLRSHSVDLVAVAQAFHWFDRARFYPEVKRVLKPGGVIAIWCYGLCAIAPHVDVELRSFYQNEIGPYWPPERWLVDEGYHGVEFPFAEIEAPVFHMAQQWDLARFVAYLRSWSAVQNCLKDTGRDPLISFVRKLHPLWGEPAARRCVTWPLFVRAGRSPA